MAEETGKKSPGLSGFGAAYKAARTKYKESGGTDPYDKKHNFDYKGKDGITRPFHVAMAGVDDKASAGRAKATTKSDAPKSDAPAKSEATTKSEAATKSDAPKSDTSRHDKIMADFRKNDVNLVEDMGKTQRDALIDAGIEAALNSTYALGGAGLLRGAVKLGGGFLAKRALRKAAQRGTGRGVPPSASPPPASSASPASASASGSRRTPGARFRTPPSTPASPPSTPASPASARTSSNRAPPNAGQYSARTSQNRAAPAATARSATPTRKGFFAKRADRIAAKKTAQKGTGRVVSAEEIIARANSRIPDKRPLLPKQVAAARKASDSDLAAVKSRVQKANSARLNDEITYAEAKDLREGYKKGGTVKADDTLKKIPGGPSRLSGFGAAFNAARAKFEKSGGTDPYAKSAQFPYNGKMYNVAKAGEEREINRIPVDDSVLNRIPPDDAPIAKMPLPSKGPLRSLRTKVALPTKQSRDAAYRKGAPDRVMRANAFRSPVFDPAPPVTLGRKPAAKMGYDPSIAAAATTRPRPFSLEGFGDTPEGKAKKAAAAAKKAEAARVVEDKGLKKGGVVKAKKKPLPFWMKKKGAKSEDKAEGPMKYAKGGMVKGSRGNGCAQRGFK